MVRRLTEIYQPGDQVQIWLGHRWLPGEVVSLAHPGLWVQTGSTRWFVTNRRHIRPAGSSHPPELARRSR